MIAFRDLLGCEIYKVNRKHTLLKLAIAIAVIIIGMLLIDVVVNGVIGDFMYPEYGNAQEYVEYYQSQIQEFEASQNWLTKLLPNQTLYGLKAQLSVYQYIVDNGIASNNFTTFGGSSVFVSNFYDFTEACMSVVMAVVVIFLVVACCLYLIHI